MLNSHKTLDERRKTDRLVKRLKRAAKRKQVLHDLKPQIEKLTRIYAITKILKAKI